MREPLRTSRIVQAPSLPAPGAPPERAHRLGLDIACLLALLLPACAPAPVAETSVRPGVNDRFLSPELEIDWALKTFEGESREVFTSREAIAERLELAPGMTVADVGAGTGLFLPLLARAVGPSGKVYAVDISEKLVDFMKERIRQAGWKHVEARLGTPRSVPLPDASLDVVLACDTYHHFEYPRSMLASLHRALRPGGRLVIVDFERLPGTSRDWVLEHVRAGKEEAIAEIEAAGFHLVDAPPVPGLRENYLLRFERR